MTEEIRNLLTEIATMNVENNLGSKVRGNKNWAIRVMTYSDDYKPAEVGRYGTMNKLGYLGASFKDIAKYQIRWYYFTYKKDFDEAVKKLEENGYRIYWN